MKRKLVPDIVNNQTIHSVSPDESVAEAARRMAEHRIAALAVMEGGKLGGIITERDMTARVVALGKDPATTNVGDVMTHDPDVLPPDALASEALKMMRDRGFRHVPVVENGQIVAMVSIRDLYASVQDQLERDIAERDAYIFGESYGATA